ncbi:hypothetical protein F0Q45_11965 [Mycobacterium simiae]|uniref:Uncharacterized protein n=1 Tax=Mycobacterium simiae TaxID=1784 RepID=A0A5B1BN36_MYCSI|nr:hypothetical protein [Mycobacterium simiae]KAA1250037.1 hypothetical protein F0Q45_11965 [Mycobacterium simiae]
MVRLYEVYATTSYGCTAEQFAAVFFRGDDVRVVLFYGESDEIAGFSYTAFEPMHHEGRTLTLINAGVFFRPGYHGGTDTGLFGLKQALRFKLCHPLSTLVYVTRCSSPAVYRLLASTMSRIYPSPRCPTPPDIEALARAASTLRNYVSVGQNPWIVRTIAIPRYASRLRTIEEDPLARYFSYLAPRYAAGECLLVWLPLDAANIAGGLLRLLRRRFAV